MPRILIDRNIPVPMRNGAILRADIYRPDVDTPLPAILCRLPYNKDDWMMQMEAVHPLRACDAGYAVVYQDTRGRWASEGEFYPFIHEAQDGYDTVEWLAAQPWCDGNIGMTGASYFGATQWLAASAQPPHLRAIFPVVTGSDYYEGWTYQGGAFQLGFTLLWVLMAFAPDTAARWRRPDVTERLLKAIDDIETHYRHTPLSTLPILRETQIADYFFDWLAHSSNDAYWQAIAPNRRYGQVQVPAFNVGGWYDCFASGTVENFVRMRQEGASDIARSGQRLLMGPWAHGKWTGDYPDLSYGITSSADGIDLHGLALRFFDRHLKGLDNGFDQEAPVRIFVMGENRWREEWEWPLARTQFTPWFLHSDGRANGAGYSAAGGSLDPAIPAGGEPADLYLYDPRQPVPTAGGATFLPSLRLGANAGPRIQREIEARGDVLVYSSMPLAQPLEVTGPVGFELWATTTAPDTDFVVRLCDVWPDGESRLACEGILRTRFHAGFEQPNLITPGRVYHYHIDLGPTSHVFLAGHRLRIDITSSSFPRFDVNPNTGRPLGVDGPTDVRPALQAVLHTSNFPSHVMLPVIPRE